MRMTPSFFQTFADSPLPDQGAHHVAYGTGADMRLHELERTTFAAMSDMMRKDPSVPLHFASQVEYREQVRRAYCLWTPGEGADEDFHLQPRPTGKDDELSQLGLISRYYPDVRRQHSRHTLSKLTRCRSVPLARTARTARRRFVRRRLYPHPD